MLLLFRHRFITDTWGWEIPASWAEPGENPTETIRRKVLEDTGYRVSTMRPLTTYNPMFEISSQQYQLFVGSDVERIGEPEPTEASRVEWIPLALVPQLMTAGQVLDGPSLTALAYYHATTQ